MPNNVEKNLTNLTGSDPSFMGMGSDPNHPNESCVIVGLGKSGLSCIEFFAKQGWHCPVIDSRENPPNLDIIKEKFPEFKVYTGGFHPEILKKAKTVILSPGISKADANLLAALSDNKNVSVIGDIELFARVNSTPLIAITGSNGKSTVTTLVGEMAKRAGFSVGVGGNLGEPALSLLDPKHSLYVLELSSFQLETTYSLKSIAATVLNISPDHMDRYSNLEDYLAAKTRIFQHAKTIVCNRQETNIQAHIPSNISTTSFGLDEPRNDEDFGIFENCLVKGKTKLLPISELKMFGRHNVANCLAALALGEQAELPMEAMISVLKEFTGLPHRCELVKKINGVPWINDSKGTNVGATKAALEGLGQDIEGKWVLIAGGVGKNADFSPLKSNVRQYCRAVILMGESKDELYHCFKDEVTCFKVDNLASAIHQANTIAKPNDGVLLSPACASFDMFKNFEERGDAFKALVMELMVPN